MSEAILDSSAVLALLLAEPGAEIVAGVLPGALLARLRNLPAMTAEAMCARLPGIDVVLIRPSVS